MALHINGRVRHPVWFDELFLQDAEVVHRGRRALKGENLR
jgi:hypothetical protein